MSPDNYIEKIRIQRYRVEFIERCPSFKGCSLKECIPESEGARKIICPDPESNITLSVSK